MIRRWLAVIVLGTSVLCGTSARASSIDVTWNDCALESAAYQLNLVNCTSTTQVASCYFTVVVDQTIPDFVAASVNVIFEDQSYQAIHPFWRFDSVAQGGCNSTGVVANDDAEPSQGRCAGELSPWGFAGNEATPTIQSYVAPLHGVRYWGELVAAVFRDPGSPTVLQAGTHYYLGHLTFNTQKGGTCGGCDLPVGVACSATLYGLGGPPVEVSGEGKVSSYLVINGGARPTPVARTSWAQLKSLYR